MSRFRKRHPKVGASPGTLVIPADPRPPRIRLMDYNVERLDEREITDIEELVSVLDSESVTWVDVQGIGNEATMRRLGQIFSLHPLALEDVVNVPQRPKCEPYENHLLFITRMVRSERALHLIAEQVSIFVGKHYVLTFQEAPGDVFDPVRNRIRKGAGSIRKLGPDYTAYALLDCIVDSYYPLLETIGDFLEKLEGRVIRRPTPAVLRQIYRVRRELLTLRRAIWPQREAVGNLIRDDSPFVTDTVCVFLRDTQDHCVQIVDGVETYRELAASLMDVYLSGIANRQNEIMKVLTIMASIFVPLTFVAGVYGMNFDNMPELHARWGYPIALGVMASMGAGMFLFFRRLGWVGALRRRRRDG